MESILTVCHANDKTITMLPASILESGNSHGRYNTVSATAEEIARLRKVLPPDTPLGAPPRNIYTFSYFAALVRQNQDMKSEDPHTVKLPLWLAVEILSYQNSYQITGVVSETAIYEIEDALSPFVQPDIFNTKRYFIRLNDYLPKDSEKAKMPISSLRQLVLCLLTSNRARGDFEAHVMENRQVHIYLHVWDDEMARGVEFRCFVPPVARFNDSRPRMVAASQYYWHRSFPVAAFEPRDTVDVALTSAEEILGQILSTATARGTLQELKAWSFTFDIVIKRGGRVQLVEVNPFGVDSRCGSCLFHWIDDAKLLYGGKNGIEVRLLI
ncbi:uncharacterized protein M437DRAFT_82953 [Aureobasidium melanogenum CBS 110374]|uniref:Uncharacterized protein n=1 Tax=Aureobasidium melanogenum (strain CBS 110374) TaxID=1043003 RepID=A0A074W4V0_AURM1|nr:uncharacterized protein M437DRAFT_82953 [Aureobasidium melanogenum CBS 110374]KEQ64967.1 hypothetical protein M437DRAFT_82953 [Aureobasidium melanogenum CBS 110374]